MTWEWQALVALALSNIVLCLAWRSSQRRLAATSALAARAVREFAAFICLPGVDHATWRKGQDAINELDERSIDLDVYR